MDIDKMSKKELINEAFSYSYQNAVEEVYGASDLLMEMALWDEIQRRGITPDDTDMVEAAAYYDMLEKMYESEESPDEE